MVRVAALSQVHQQLGGLLPHGWVAVLCDCAELGDDHSLDQLILQADETAWKSHNGYWCMMKPLFYALNVLMIVVCVHKPHRVAGLC